MDATVIDRFFLWKTHFNDRSKPIVISNIEGGEDLRSGLDDG